MLSDVSSLTDMSSDDEDYKPAKSNSKPKKGRPKKEWQPKQVLKAPRLTQYSTQTLYEEILNGKVDLDPEYQRDVVWPDAKQSGLIDSILRNFYIPPVIFAFSQNEDGEERRTCIDGKQRLTSIQRFMDGQIPFKDSRTNLKLWYKRQPWNETGKLLPPQYKKQFNLKQIGCVEYTDLDDDAEREIFQRVQLGVALTPAERMQAIAGPWSQLVRTVLNELDQYKINDVLDWSKTRGRDFHSVATIIYILDKSHLSYPSVTMLEKWLRRVTPPPKEFSERVLEVFKVFRQLVLTKKHSVVFQKPTRISPIEFVMILVLIDAHYKKHTLTQLADGIRLMRKDVRSKHEDIRANTKVTKTIFGFIRDRWPGKDLKKEPGEKKALDECNANPVPKAVERGKRKRTDNDSSDSESSEDERPLKMKTKTAVRKSSSTQSKITPQTSASAPVPSKAPAPKPESGVKVKTESISTPESRSSAPPDRLDKVRQVKQRIGLNASSQDQALTPPPTAPPASMGQALLPQQSAQNFVNNASLPPNMWPNQFQQQMAMRMMFGQNIQPLGQGAMAPPSSNPNVVSPTDPHANQFFSGPPTANLQGANGQWVGPNDPSNPNGAPTYVQQRSVSVPTIPGLRGSSQGRDSPYDHQSTGTSSRQGSPLQSLSEPLARDGSATNRRDSRNGR